MHEVGVAFQTDRRVIFEVFSINVRDGSCVLQMFREINLWHFIRVSEGLSFMAKQTKTLVAVFENSARGLVFPVEQMAGSTPHERVLMFCEVLDDCRMTVLAGKNYRMVRNLFCFFLGTRIMAILTLKNSGVNSRLLHLFQQK